MEIVLTVSWFFVEGDLFNSLFRFTFRVDPLPHQCCLCKYMMDLFLISEQMCFSSKSGMIIFAYEGARMVLIAQRVKKVTNCIPIITE